MTMNVVDWLLQTDSGAAGLILRLTLAIVMFPHGAQKALGWFGGHGFNGTVNYLRFARHDTGLEAAQNLEFISAQ